MQQSGGMDKLNRRRQMDVIRPGIAAHTCGGQGQHRAQAFAPGLNQMGGDLRYAGGMLGGHALADQMIDGSQIFGQGLCQAIMGF